MIKRSHFHCGQENSNAEATAKKQNGAKLLKMIKYSLDASPPQTLPRPQATYLVDNLLLLGMFLPQLCHLSPQSAVLPATKPSNNAARHNKAYVHPGL